MLPAIPTEGLPLPGNERYVLRALLGRGGFGEAYVAEDQALARKVVIKLLTELGDATVRERFTREARIAANIKHPAVVQVHDIGALPDGRPYFVMEFADGTNLAQFKAERSLVPTRDALTLVAEASEGLAAAHRMGVIHRDIKPENILVTREGKAKLIDFGIAKQAVNEAAARDDGSNVTRDGVVLGTPRYVSPEQAMAQPLGASSDLYSLGCVLYELLTGRSPFDGNAPQLMVQHAQTPAPTLAAGNGARTYSPQLEGIVARLLSKDAARRYQDGDELARVLRNEIAALPEVSAHATSVTRASGDATPLLAVSAVAAAPSIAAADTAPALPVAKAPDTRAMEAVVASPTHAGSAVRASRVAAVVGALALVALIGVGAMFMRRRTAEPESLATPKALSETSVVAPSFTVPAMASQAPVTTGASTAAVPSASVSAVFKTKQPALTKPAGSLASKPPSSKPPSSNPLGAIEDR